MAGRNLLWSDQHVSPLWSDQHVSPPPKHGVVVLASWMSNGQQVVTFRPDPLEAEIAYASVASASDDGSTQPSIHRSGAFVLPVPRPDETNYTLTFLATPLRGASMGGKPLACTPGCYTVAYTPQQPVNRVRVGVALPIKGMSDVRRRLARAWLEKSLGPLFLRSHEDPVFVVTQPFTNDLSGVGGQSWAIHAVRQLQPGVGVRAKRVILLHPDSPADA